MRRGRRLAGLLLAVVAVACAPRTPSEPAAPTPIPVPPPHTAAQLAGAEEITDLALSPAGDELAFVTDRSGSPEIWTAPIVAGRAGTAVRRTETQASPGGLVYAPNGDLVFQTDRDAAGRYDLWLLPKGAAAAVAIAATDLSEKDAAYSPDGSKLAYLADTDRRDRFDVLVRDLASATVRTVTHEQDDVGRPVWTPDGTRIVAAVTPDGASGTLLVVEVATGREKRITPPRGTGEIVPQGFLPGGLLLATARNDSGFMQLCRVDLSSGAVKFLGTVEWDVGHVAVAGSGDVLYERNVRGESEVVLARNLSGHAATRPLLDVIAEGGVVTATAIGAAGGLGAFVREGATRPAEVLLSDLTEYETRPAVDARLPGVDLRRLAGSQRRSFRSPDGTEIDAFIWLPRVGRLGSPPPLVVVLHGEPDGQARPSFHPLVQALVEAGFAVAAPNYRGSSGYGAAFAAADDPARAAADVLAVIEGLAAERLVDGRRVGITGSGPVLDALAARASETGHIVLPDESRTARDRAARAAEMQRILDRFRARVAGSS